MWYLLHGLGTTALAAIHNRCKLICFKLYVSLLKKKLQNQIKMLPILAESKGGVRKKNYFEKIIYTFQREKG